jgi:hypothetical protein
MLINQKLPNSQWIAHDNTTSDVLPASMRGSLLGCKAGYIWNYQLLDEDDKKQFLPLTAQEIVDRFEYLIPCNIEFVIVTLHPRWETTVK